MTGPFTVESLSPHRVLSTDEERPRSEQDGQRDSVAGQFETMILDNLRKAGVQNTVKDEQLVFDRLEPLAGTWLQASGSYTDADGKSRRVAVSIGPEHGTVGPNQVKEAAKEAVLDVYDPTTGAIRSHSTDDIAWWFIDTNYDGESFFVRHAYFTGADEPYEKLKRALKAEIDEAAFDAERVKP